MKAFKVAALLFALLFSVALFAPADLTLSAPQAVAQSGTWTVQPGNTPNTTPWLIAAAPNSAQSTLTLSIFTALTTTQTFKSSAGNFYGWSLYNPNSSLCVLQVFNTTSTTLGTTQELLDIPVAATSVQTYFLPIPVPFSVAMSGASTTAAHGATTCTTGMIANVFYK